MDHQSLIRWLRECYREDHTRAGVRDFMSSTLENRQMIKGEDKLACGFLEEEVISPARAQKLLLNLSLHQREKEYLYGCLFFLGKIGGKVYRAPLILYPAKAKRMIDFRVDSTEWLAETVTLDHGLYRINYSLLDVLDNKQQIEAGVMEALRDSGGVLSCVAVSDIANVIRENMPEVNVEGLMDWPYLTCVSAVNSKLGTGLKLVPAAGFVVVKRSTGSSGVVDELENLGGLNQAKWSAALKSLFDGGITRELKYKPSLAPVLLSETQEHILKSARSNDLTVCHGPPGTGKSFTLAAIAIDHIARGDTVLVVSKKDHAVDVLYKKIQDLLKSKKAIVRAGRSSYLKNIKGRVSRLLAIRHPSPGYSKGKMGTVADELMKNLKQIENEEQQLSEEYRKAISRGEVFAKPDPRWYEKILKLWYKSEVKNRPILLDLASHLNQLHQQKEIIIRKLIDVQQKYLVSSVMINADTRNDLRKLLKGLKKHKSSEQINAFLSADFDSILNVFPIWITSLSDLHRVLPPKKEMFDVVIIDEASQCDLASALPAIQRAKRVVIAGDAKQLRHVSFIARSSMQKFASDLKVTPPTQEKHDYRNVSLMDLAIENTNEASQVALLNEHFRSLKPIIDFSNSEFYQGDLRLMRDRPWEKVSDQTLIFKYFNGDRGEDGVNATEIRAVIADLEVIIESDDNRYEPLTSIGILSPFRAQVDALTQAVNEWAQKTGLSHRLTKHQLKIGTAHSFQGEERDIMLISMALGRADNSGSRRFLEQEDIFNVSITRARHQQVIYHSVLPQDLPIASLLSKYLSSAGILSTSAEKDDTGKILDRFAEDFSAACENRQISSKIGVSVASIPVDVLLEKNGKYLGVDLVGHPGYMQDAVAINQQQILERAGMILVPVGYVEWQVQQENVLAGIEKLLN